MSEWIEIDERLDAFTQPVERRMMMNKWIDLNECRPEFGEDVLLFDNDTPNQKICIGCLIVEDKTCVQLADSGSIMDLDNFSHWMPLPEQPKGE